MCKAVFTSIQKPHTDNIFAGIKGVEWRTRPMPTGKHYCYETKNGGGVGKVIGECDVWRIKRYDTISSIPVDMINAGCVSREFLHEYSKGRPLYAHFLINPKLYDKPKEITQFLRPCERDFDIEKCMGCKNLSYNDLGFECCDRRIIRPPQSWCYVEDV